MRDEILADTGEGEPAAVVKAVGGRVIQYPQPASAVVVPAAPYPKKRRRDMCPAISLVPLPEH